MSGSYLSFSIESKASEECPPGGLMRDPSRDYIMRRLYKRYKKHEVEDRLSRYVRFDTESHRRKLQSDPKSVMDINNFEHIVSGELECFEQNITLVRKLGEIREYRNRIVHPEYDAPPNRGRTIKTLNNIADTLKIMGVTEASNEVRELKAVLSDNVREDKSVSEQSMSLGEGPRRRPARRTGPSFGTTRDTTCV